MSSPVLDGARALHQQRKVLRCRAALRRPADADLVVRTIDISTAGVSIMSEQSLAVGSSCRLAFLLPVHGKLHEINASVKVLYNTCQGTDGFRLGLRFTESDPVRDGMINSLF